MDATLLLSTLPDCDKQNIYLLFEAGAQDQEAFEKFRAQYAPDLFSLYQHPQLTDFQQYGPWLLKVKNKAQLVRLTVGIPGCTGVLLSPRSLSSLAIQLSKGCVVIKPDGSTALVRFYAGQVISVLARENEQAWHALLFKEITQWWVPVGARWQQLLIPASMVKDPVSPAVRLSTHVWQEIADPPLIGTLLEQWQKMPAARHFPSCTQRAMVIKALSKAKSAGLINSYDQMLYALYYLNGGKTQLESASFSERLHSVMQGEKTFRDILTAIQEQ